MKNNLLYQVLIENYGVSMTKTQVSKVIKCGLSTLNLYISKGYNHPNYIKLGKGKNSKVIFPTHEVVSFLENTFKSL